MADLNFPASPVDGQTYGEYTYVASKGVWQSIPGLPAGVPAGTILGWGGSTAPDQWLICDGSAVSRSTYSSLFAAIGTVYGTGDGSTTFNLPDLRGKIPVGSASATSLGTATITIAAPGVVTKTAHGLATGQMVYFTTTGTLPTGITATTGRYWVIVTGANTFTLATSLANALAGTAITTSGSQTGTHTVYSYDFELGKSNGEVNHKQTQNELVSHTHTLSNGGTNIVTDATSGINWATAAGASYGFKSSVNNNTGGSLPWNNLQPYQVVNYIIKYAAAYVPQESELSPRVTNLESGVTNYILNGAFDIWQRGTSFTSPSLGTYVADRWATNVPPVSTISRQSASLTGFQYCMRVQRNSGQTTINPLYVGQPFENSEAIQLAGKTVTLSFYARAGANFSSSANALAVTVSSGTGASDVNRMSVAYTGDVTVLATSVTLTTSWQRFSLNLTFGSTITQFMPYFSFAGSGTAGANDYFEITGVQLQTGSTATSFRRNAPSIQAELTACQRYYLTMTFNGGTSADTTYSRNNMGVVFPTTMRTTPVVTATSSTMAGHHTNLPNIVTPYQHSVGFEWNGTNYRAGANVIITFNANAEL